MTSCNVGPTSKTFSRRCINVRFWCLFSLHFTTRPSRIKSRAFKSWKSKFYCVDMGSHTFRAFSTMNVSWICCNCNNPNYEQNLFHSFQIETANSFHPLDLPESIEIKSPISDFVPVLHSSLIIDHRHSKKI